LLVSILSRLGHRPDGNAEGDPNRDTGPDVSDRGPNRYA
jgi:hypothetical protein